MENKNNGILIAIIVILVMALLGLGFYMAYDKGLIFNSENETEENETEVEENETKVEENQQPVEKYNYTEISNLLNNKLSYFFARSYDKNGIDLLSVTDLRLVLVNYLLLSDSQEIYDGQGRSVSYDKYSSKYNELYGTNYSLETDLANVSSGAVARKQDNNITWNATGTSGLTYTLTAQNITNNNNIYVLTGTYTRTDANDNSTTNGTFEIKYTENGNAKNLKSIVVTNK